MENLVRKSVINCSMNSTNYISEALLQIWREQPQYEERNILLLYLMFIKENLDRTIKARVCADGQS